MKVTENKSTFRGEPAEFNITLSLRELEILTTYLGSTSSTYLVQDCNGDNWGLVTQGRVKPIFKEEAIDFLKNYSSFEGLVIKHNSILPPQILRKVQFVYDKDGEQPKWRTVEVTTESAKYLEGIEGGVFKRFLKEKIVGGKTLPA